MRFGSLAAAVRCASKGWVFVRAYPSSWDLASQGALLRNLDFRTTPPPPARSDSLWVGVAKSEAINAAFKERENPLGIFPSSYGGGG